MGTVRHEGQVRFSQARLRRVKIVLLLSLFAVPLVAQTADTDMGVELLEVGYPDLSQFQEGIQTQITSSRGVLDRLIEDLESEPVELSEAFGSVGQLYLLYDFPDLAEACFTNASRLQPDDYRWHYYLAVVFQFDGRFEEAGESLERSLALSPNDVPALIRLGNSRFSLGAIDEAGELYDQALDLDPSSAAAYDGLGRVAAKQGDQALAIEYFEAALQLQASADSVHHRLGMAYRAQRDLDQARHHLALSKGSQVRFKDPLVDGLSSLVRSTQMHFNAGVDAMRAGNFEEAVRQFELAYEEKPDDYLVPYNLASALMSLGDYEGGKKWLRKSIEIDPDFRNGHFNLATVLAGEGDVEAATQHFQRAHEIDPEDQVAHLEWATALSMIGQPARAADELERLLDLNPNNSQALLNLGIIRGSLGQSEQAKAIFGSALEMSLDPRVQAQAHYRLGILSLEEGRQEDAIGYLRRSVELDPRFLEVQSALAVILGQMGRYAEAADQFARLIKIQPDNLQARFGRVMSLILAEKYAQARRELEESLLVFSQETSLQHVLARLLATCPDDKVRDVDRALLLAMGVYERSPRADHAETVAMALAAAGRFDEAVSWQEKVVQQAEVKGQKVEVDRVRRRLERYRRGEVERSPW